MAKAKNLDAGVRAFFDIIESSAAQAQQSPSDVMIERLMGVRAEAALLTAEIDKLVMQRDKLLQDLEAGVDALLKGDTQNPTVARVMVR